MPKRDLRLLIEQKRQGEELSGEDWAAVVDQALRSDSDPAQISALFMASYFSGMSVDETVALTRAMVASGDVLHFSRFSDAVDKHSTGGVGDTASMLVVPILAACGERVAKLSGRALGHTGGTLDKLESIPGLRVEIEPEEFESIIADIGCSIAAQSKRLVPADKVLYALRDRTGTVPCVGLIAASIISKKIAGSAQRIVFDVKTGSGAFMKTLPEARTLATMLVEVSSKFNRDGVAVITGMDEPLGPNIGNGLEVIMAREFLRASARPARLATVVRELCVALLSTHLGDEQAKHAVDEALNGEGPLRKFEAMIVRQGGDIDAFRRMETPSPTQVVTSRASGHVRAIDAECLGNAARALSLGNGPLGGLRVLVSIGDYVQAAQPLVEIIGTIANASEVQAAFELTADAVPPQRLIYDRICSEPRSTGRLPHPQYSQ
ncbi:MAG: thymidine phosphorylase [Candidatus Eremiobacteraeota bacterium]|nr:thymidine phosphorylase [Candidatus Eremiobacteraeota bacterium]